MYFCLCIYFIFFIYFNKLIQLTFHYSYASNNLTWLQKQQLKLKERREMVLREERQPHDTLLLSELRSVQNRHMRPTASHRLDGYTSDTTAFADDDEDFSIPLHINTTSKSPGSIPDRTSSKNYNTIKSTYSNSTLRSERPFVAVKKAHQDSYAQVRKKLNQNIRSYP